MLGPKNFTNEAMPLCPGNGKGTHHHNSTNSSSAFANGVNVDKERLYLSSIELRSYNALPANAESGDESHPGEIMIDDRSNKNLVRRVAWFLGGFSLLTMTIAMMSFARSGDKDTFGAAWSSKAQPFSTVNPASLNVITVDRPFSKPGPVFGQLLERGPKNELKIPLPTNNWYENLLLGSSNVDEENKVFQVPYIIDTSGYIQGVRTHPAHVQANDRTVMMTYELKNGMSLGAVEKFDHQHHVHTSKTVPRPSKLAIELEWVSSKEPSQKMRCPIVRGAPYTTMEYVYTTPRIFVERALKGDIVVDNNKFQTMKCGSKLNHFGEPVLVTKELKVNFDTSDMTWLIFVSQPTEFVCTNKAVDNAAVNNLPPGVIPPAQDAAESPFFELRATQPMRRGMVRIAMSNNCTTGQNPQYCVNHQPKDEAEFEKLLRDHSNVYPTAEADIQFTFPVQSSEEEELRLIFNWKSAQMSDLAIFDNDDSLYPSPDIADKIDYYHGGSVRTGYKPPSEELLMFALPHHQERMRPTFLSSNTVKQVGCSPTIHGLACPAIGGVWSMVEHLHRASFHAPRVPREEMIDSLQDALKKDILYELPANYMAGAGDTYFSGKMLAKLARILLIAEEVGGVSKKDFNAAVGRLRAGVEIWINGSAESPLLFDTYWGGMVMCGCDYYYENDHGGCRNSYPNCPALTDAGQNFGAGFYNDHHFHFGYHIYAAAVVSKYDPEWGRKYHEHVLLLVRDIANPSDEDLFFPKWRHKDWFVGFSWASGIVTINGKPYPNGRNQESSSEAISAYEAVALYGDVLSTLYSNDSPMPSERAIFDSALRIRDMGRLLMATEIRSAKTYWHVQARETTGVSRIYPDIYQPKVIGMMWSMLAQEQTWFGNEPWKSYGIQIMPITPASEQRDSGTWLNEMLPLFADSCLSDQNCVQQGWSVLVYASMASIGEWRTAWKGLQSLNDSVFLEAGGNGHSLSNSLWYVSTRPDADEIL